MERRESSTKAPLSRVRVQPVPGVARFQHRRDPPAEPSEGPIRYWDIIGWCRLLQPGCQRLYLRWRKDKAPVCANPRCRRKFYLLLKLRRDGRLTKEEFEFELSALEFDFVDSFPWEERQDEYESLKARLGRCEIRATGCLRVAINWRKDRIPARRGNGRTPMACGNRACWRRAATWAYRERMRTTSESDTATECL